jgi:carbonic anhydrase
MGHTHCGAVQATVDEIRHRSGLPSENIRDIVERIRPAVEGLVHTRAGVDDEVLLREAMRANVRASAEHLRHGSPILEGLIREGKLAVVGAEYDLESGRVDFFDGAPAPR